jgi:hypothetical protein
MPRNRYLGGACFIDRKHLFFKTTDLSLVKPGDIREMIEPALLVFGGDAGLPYNNFLGDQWLLTIQGIHVSSENSLSKTREFCFDVLDSSNANYNFDISCGFLADIHSKNPCRWEDVVRRAWCLQQYNSFMSPF